jgi:hypothetical protein
LAWLLVRMFAEIVRIDSVTASAPGEQHDAERDGH